jgi:hypothetical protein
MTEDEEVLDLDSVMAQHNENMARQEISAQYKEIRGVIYGQIPHTTADTEGIVLFGAMPGFAILTMTGQGFARHPDSDIWIRILHLIYVSVNGGATQEVAANLETVNGVRQHHSLMSTTGIFIIENPCNLTINFHQAIQADGERTKKESYGFDARYAIYHV